MRATLDDYDPRALGDRLTGPKSVGVDELDVNGRSLNRPVPIREFQVRVCEGDAIRSLSEHIIGGQPKCVQRVHFRSCRLSK